MINFLFKILPKKRFELGKGRKPIGEIQMN